MSGIGRRRLKPEMLVATASEVAKRYCLIADLKTDSSLATDPHRFFSYSRSNAGSRILWCSDKHTGQRLAQFVCRESLSAHEVMPFSGCEVVVVSFCAIWDAPGL